MKDKMGYAAGWGGVDGSVVPIKEERSANHCWDDGQGGLLETDLCWFQQSLLRFMPPLY